MPDHLLRVDTLAVDHSGDLAVGSTGIKADAAAIHMTTDGAGGLIGLGAGTQGQIQDLQLALIELLEEIIVEESDTLGGVGLLQLLSDLAAAADAHTEATDGPQQELDIALHIAIVSLSHLGGTVDEGVTDGNMALIPLHSDGEGLLSTLEVGIRPDTEGDKLRVKGRNMLQIVAYA